MPAHKKSDEELKRRRIDQLFLDAFSREGTPPSTKQIADALNVSTKLVEKRRKFLEGRGALGASTKRVNKSGRDFSAEPRYDLIKTPSVEAEIQLTQLIAASMRDRSGEVHMKEDLAIRGTQIRPDILAGNQIIECKHELDRSSVFLGIGQLLFYRRALEQRESLFSHSRCIEAWELILVGSGYRFRREELTLIIDVAEKVAVRLCYWNSELADFRDLKKHSTSDQ